MATSRARNYPIRAWRIKEPHQTMETGGIKKLGRAGITREAGFLTTFVVLYCAMYVGYAAIPDEILRDRVYFHAIVRPSAALINWVAPSEHVVGVDNRLQASTAALNVVRGCDGASVLFLLIAAMIAYRSGLCRTLVGILGAVVLVYAMNELRIVGLYFVVAHRAAWFMPLHVYWIPTVMIIIGTLYFAVWASRRADDDRAPAAA